MCKTTSSRNNNDGNNKKYDCDPDFLLEEQLHEQYAINNNSNLSSVIVLLASMIAVFSGFAYMFVNSTVEFSNKPNWALYDKCSQTYYFDAFIFTAIACLIVIHIMIMICIYQGYQQRYEQFITYAIRNKYIKEYWEKTGNDKRSIVFPKDYHPFPKEGNNNCSCPLFISNKYKDPIQGLFGEFVKIFCYLEWIIMGGVFIKILSNACKKCGGDCHCLGIIEISILVIAFILLRFSLFKYISERYEKYKRRCDEYKHLNPTNNK